MKKMNEYGQGKLKRVGQDKLKRVGSNKLPRVSPSVLSSSLQLDGIFDLDFDLGKPE